MRQVESHGSSTSTITQPALRLLGEDAHRPELLVAVGDELLGRELLQLGEVAPDGLADGLRGGVVIAVRAAGAARGRSRR